MDYSAVDSVLSFFQSGRACVDVDILDDNAVEGVERFQLTASLVQSISGVADILAEVSIVDDPLGKWTCSHLMLS